MTRPKDNHPRWGRLVVAIVAAVLMLTSALVACAPADSGLHRDAARHLQARVLGVSQAAAGNDPAAALAALDSLEADLAAASSSGQVSEDRRRTIMTAVAAVRADLTASKAEADAAAAKAAEEAVAAEKAAADAAAKAAADAAVPPMPAAPAPADNGKGGKGKGKDG
ncbi:mucin-associated surface protein [Arthrobacter sp. ISL-48]|uniref:mucin-associated surface protein n=1 Tax=Arthrobacter sp. ISL-48 TaxID=2819110 RepID=UPI001BEC2EC9|nr:mucin-associated surface protein [Arthrobacter sp. ISL-48]MBT2530896.1 mucin-associated surface protein [Arthrobacter sp. ISL-48]